MLAPIRPSPIIPSCIGDSFTRTSYPRFTDVVPQPDDRLVAAVVLEAEHPHAGRVAEEEPPGRRRHAEPAGRDHPDDVATRKRQHVAGEAVDPGEEAVGPDGDVFGRFAVGAAVAVEFPA